MGVATEINCPTNTFTAILKLLGKLEGQFDFTECVVNKPAGCTMNAGEIKTERISGALEGPMAGPPKLQLGAAGVKWVTLELEGMSCVLNAHPFELTGAQGCTVDASYITEQAEHEFVCAGSGSALKLGGKAATLSTSTKDKLNVVGNWSMKLN